VLRAVVLTQYRRVTDGQTDGIAIASTVLAMRALRRAVKKLVCNKNFATSLKEEQQIKPWFHAKIKLF